MPLAGRLADRLGSARLCRLAGLAVAVLPLALWTASTPGRAHRRPAGLRRHRRPDERGPGRPGCPDGAGLRAAADGLVLRVLQPGRAGRGGPGRAAGLARGRPGRGPRHYRGGHGHRAGRRALAARRVRRPRRPRDRRPEPPGRPARPADPAAARHPVPGPARAGRGSRMARPGLVAADGTRPARLVLPDSRGRGGQLERALPAGQPGRPAGNPGRRVRGLLPGHGRGAAGRRPAGRPVRPCGHGPQVRPAGLGRAGFGITQPRLARCGHRVRRQRRPGSPA